MSTFLRRAARTVSGPTESDASAPPPEAIPIDCRQDRGEPATVEGTSALVGCQAAHRPEGPMAQERATPERRGV
jgi:hypothetical protein